MRPNKSYNYNTLKAIILGPFIEEYFFRYKTELLIQHLNTLQKLIALILQCFIFTFSHKSTNMIEHI